MSTPYPALGFQPEEYMTDDEFKQRLKSIAATLDPATLAALKEAHAAYGFMCNAHSEGQDCCIDLLIELT